MKLDRMIGILSVLLQEDKVTAQSLAERFEVSRRTILRDIDALCRAGIPLVTDRGPQGGISIMDGYKLDRTLLTTADMGAILAGLRSLDSVSGTGQYAQLMEKLSAGTSRLMAGDQHILIDLSSWNKASLAPKIEQIHSAIREKQRISFHYNAPQGESDRTIEPYYLVFQWANWYVWGWCMAREDFRLFKLNRMTEVQTFDNFLPRPAPMPDLSAEKVFPHHWQVKAVIRPEHKWRLIEEFGPDSYTVQSDGTLLFQFGFTEQEEIVRWAISFGGGAELLEPAELREDILAFAENIHAVYEKI